MYQFFYDMPSEIKWIKFDLFHVNNSYTGKKKGPKINLTNNFQGTPLWSPNIKVYHNLFYSFRNMQSHLILHAFTLHKDLHQNLTYLPHCSIMRMSQHEAHRLGWEHFLQGTVLDKCSVMDSNVPHCCLQSISCQNITPLQGDSVCRNNFFFTIKKHTKL